MFKVCEDELARKKRGCGRRRGSSDSFARVDYRKRVYYDDDAEREISISASLSLSIEEPPVVTSTVLGGARPTAAP